MEDLTAIFNAIVKTIHNDATSRNSKIFVLSPRFEHKLVENDLEGCERNVKVSDRKNLESKYRTEKPRAWLKLETPRCA